MSISVQRLHEEYASKPVLIVHSDKLSANDKIALRLVKEELGDTFVLVRRKGTDPDEDTIPRLLAATSIYRGEREIKIFLNELKRMRSVQHKAG